MANPQISSLIVNDLTASKVAFTDANKKLTSTGIGTSAQTVQGDGSLITTPMTLVSTASPSAAANFTISSLSSGTYYFTYHFIQNTSTGAARLTFNADTGNNYGAGVWVANSASSGISASGALTGYPFYIPQANTVLANGMVKMEVWLKTNGNNIYINSLASYYRAGTTFWEVAVGGGTYQGSATLSSMTLTASAGTMTGELKLYQLF